MLTSRLFIQLEIQEQHSESSPISQRGALTTEVQGPDDLDSIPIVALDGLLLGV